MQSLLVYGYCREIEKALHPLIIPPGICQLCLTYYVSKNIMLQFCMKHDFLNVVKICNLDMDETVECDITIINNEKFKKSSLSGFFKSYQPQLKVPQHIIDNNPSFKATPNINTYDTIIFGGEKLLNPLCLSLDLNKQKSIIWDLPPFGEDYRGSFATSSDKHGLIVCGGYHTELYLDLNSCRQLLFTPITDDWKWQKLPSMKHKRYRPNATMINKDKLAVIGGSHEADDNHIYPTDIEVFDFEEKKWDILCQLNESRDGMGAVYDYDTGLIYFGGGFNLKLFNVNSRNCREMYYLDIEKQRVFDLGHTNTAFDVYPTIWIEEGYILNITSPEQIVEYMDLRESNKKWTKNVDHAMSTNDYVCNVQCAMLLKC